jgi:hypothetical protein
MNRAVEKIYTRPILDFIEHVDERLWFDICEAHITAGDDVERPSL